jgi:hypothetical protein
MVTISKKGSGNTTYQGALELLPCPDFRPCSRRIRTVMRFLPNVIDHNEVAMLRSMMDDLGGPDDCKWEVKQLVL